MTPKQLRDSKCEHPRPTITPQVGKNQLLTGKVKVTCPYCKKVLYDDTAPIEGLR